MKRKLITLLVIGCSFILYSSCYKTGEVIYQPTCKPDSISVNNPLYNYIYFIRREFFQGSFTYDVNRRLISATSYLLGNPERRYDFIYDGSNNLIRINTFTINVGNPNLPIFFITFKYPTGTAASLSATAQVQFNFLTFNGITYGAEPVRTYNFNTEFQLISVFQGNLKLEQLIYDNGGNCLADSEYASNQQLNDYYVYSSYDNDINPARSDRSLQLFLQMYSKNNPTNSIRYVKGLGADPNGYGVLYSSNGNYTYNINGYPLTYGGNFFAEYNCLPPVIIAPGPGAN